VYSEIIKRMAIIKKMLDKKYHDNLVNSKRTDPETTCA